MTNWNITTQELVEKAQELHDDIVIFLREANGDNISISQRSDLQSLRYHLEKIYYDFTEDELNNEQ